MGTKKTGRAATAVEKRAAATAEANKESAEKAKAAKKASSNKAAAKKAAAKKAAAKKAAANKAAANKAAANKAAANKVAPKKIAAKKAAKKCGDRAGEPSSAPAARRPAGRMAKAFDPRSEMEKVLKSLIKAAAAGKVGAAQILVRLGYVPAGQSSGAGVLDNEAAGVLLRLVDMLLRCPEDGDADGDSDGIGVAKNEGKL